MGPFLFLAAYAAAVGSVEASPVIWAASLALLCAAAVAVRDAKAPGLSPISIALWAYTLWLAATNAIANPAYSTAAPFHAAFLAAGFAMGRRLDVDARKTAFRWLAAGASGLAVWALWQTASGEASRGHAHFETPNTLAAVLNLLLAPTLAMLAWRPRWPPAVLGAILAAGLMASASRGGLLALLCALLAVLLLARRFGVPVERRGAAAVAAVLASGWLLAVLDPFSVLQWLVDASGVPGHSLAPAARTIFSEATQESNASRIELYALAASGLKGHFGLGMGYLGFNALLEAGRLAVPSYGTDSVTYFAHNDYLQTLVELGLPGLAALLAMVSLPFLIALRHGPHGLRDPRLVVAALAALATMAVHAAVDFPFYVPICLLLFGLALGTADRMLAPENAIRARWQARPARLAAIFVAALVAVLLVPPVAAEVAVDVAKRRWLSADGQRAAYWFEVARRIERRDWRYHWYVGQFWLAQATLNANPVAARQAEQAFAEGFATNPREPRNLIGRIATHRRFGNLLEAPAPPDTLRGWMEQALALAPLDAQVRLEQQALGAHLQRLSPGAAK